MLFGTDCQPLEEVDRLGDVGVPDGFGGFAGVLDDDLAQAGDGAAFGAVDFDREQVVAADSYAPAAVELADGAVFEDEDGVGAVVGSGFVDFAALVSSFGSRSTLP